MKKQNESEINALGGIDVLANQLNDLKVWKKFTEYFGNRHPRAEYSIVDVYKTWIINVICGNRRLQHAEVFRDYFIANPKFKKGISPDTISRVFRSLAVENTYYAQSTKQNVPIGLKPGQFVFDPTEEEKPMLNEVNINPNFNNLILDIALELGLLEKGKAYDLDLDATIINTKVSDGRPNYDGGAGYMPIVVLLDGIPVYMEARNGNSAPKFRNKHVLKDSIDLIKSKGVRVKLVRIDAAGCSYQVFDFLNSQKIPFCIRGSQTLRKSFKRESDPTGVEELIEDSERFVQIKARGKNIYWFDYYSRSVDDNGKVKTFGLVTNNKNLSRRKVIKKYNDRGTSEQRFADLKEMGWKVMVHRELKYNTVHMYNTMIAYLFFRYSKRWLEGQVTDITDKLEPRTFIRNFMHIATVWQGNKLVILSKNKKMVKLRVY